MFGYFVNYLYRPFVVNDNKPLKSLIVLNGNHSLLLESCINGFTLLYCKPLSLTFLSIHFYRNEKSIFSQTVNN